LCNITVSDDKPFFRANCSVEYDAVTGLASPSIEWTVFPPNLGFLISESLGKLTIFYNEGVLDENSDYHRGHFIESFSISNVTNYTIDSSGLTGEISLKENGSGIMTLHEVEPQFNPRGVEFNVSDIHLSIFFILKKDYISSLLIHTF